VNKYVVMLIALSVLLSAFAQIALKAGMSSVSVLQALQATPGLPAVRAIVTNIFVLVGLSLYFASAAVWLLVLARVDVSLAYPFVGLGFIVTMLLAWLIHGEVLTLAKVTGTILIAFGVIVLARG
jgi:multidrug transporter EmrE-like cation transporter